MNILSLNTQKGYQKNFADFLVNLLKQGYYDFLLLQEVTDKVAELVASPGSSYTTLRPYDVELEAYTHVCVLYKNTYTLDDFTFTSFAAFDPAVPKKGWGCLTGIFDLSGEKIQLSSIHLHPGIYAKIRLKELEVLKSTLNTQYPSLIAGDFNTGIPGEIVKQEKVLQPELLRVSKTIGTTLDSRYTERAPFFLNRISVFLSKMHIGFRFEADHVYANKELRTKYSINCKTLPERVSDHFAVKIVVN